MRKTVYWHPVTYLAPLRKGQTSQDYELHRVLRAIDHNTLLSKLDATGQAGNFEFMVSQAQLIQRLAAFPELIEQTQSLLNAVSITCTPKEDKNKKFFTGCRERDIEYLQTETRKGFQIRYGDRDDIWRERINKELEIIDKKGFTAYYLITYDLIQFARRNGFEYVGRGSGANSCVAYCLGITNVDPIELDLYFERFLNAERASPPDFDIDFSWDNRDAIYEYLFSTYGHEHTCLLGTHVTYQRRLVVRELGKVFGLPKGEIEELAESKGLLEPRDEISEQILHFGNELIRRELPSHLSIHAGGVLITEKPIYQYTATHTPAKGLPVSHFDMHSAEDYGIHKFDILSQRGLGHIKQTVKLAKQTRNVDVNINRFHDFKTDPLVKELLRSGKTMGCFYVESPAMRMLLKKLRCDDYLTLVAASSIIRPGVASSGMMRTYIERFHAVRNGDSYEAIHPLIDTLMRETFGVMVYQEDVIKVAHHFAGLTLTEADVLRRGMSGKYRSRHEFQQVRQRFFDCCRARGYSEKIIARVWFEIESFSGYSFAKGHSASYAVESYQSLFLKAHFPLEFMVGVINNFGGFYRSEFYFHEARMNGAAIEPPCINAGMHLTMLRGRNVIVGFVHMKGLEAKVASQLLDDRIRNGSYTSLENFLMRNPAIGLEQLRMLIRVGALRSIGKSKQQLLWQSMLYFSKTRHRPSTTADLFDTASHNFPLPALQREPLEDAFDEMELLGFPLCSPFDLLTEMSSHQTLAKEMELCKNRTVQMVGYLVTTKDTRTANGVPMHFGTFLDSEGEVFDSVHFPFAAKQFPFRGRGFYALNGKIVEDHGVFMIEVATMEKLSMAHRRPEKVLHEGW